jgi:hypothetical protein
MNQWRGNEGRKQQRWCSNDVVVVVATCYRCCRDGSLQNREELARKRNLPFKNLILNEAIDIICSQILSTQDSILNRHSSHAFTSRAHFLFVFTHPTQQTKQTITMSSKLVRKLLQVTSSIVNDAGPPTKKQKKMILKKKQQNATSTEHHDDLLDRNIASFLQLDSAMDRHGEERQHRAERVVVTTSATTKQIKGFEGGLGNSRSSSSAMHAAKPLPTLNKRRIQKERKEKQLLKISKLLKKTKKELAKSSGTPVKKKKAKKAAL